MNEKKNNNSIIAIIAIIAVVAVAVIVAAVFLLGGDKDTVKEKDEKKTEQVEKGDVEYDKDDKNDTEVFVVLAEDDDGNVAELECEVPAGIMYEDYEEEDLEGWIASNGAVECNLFYALYDGDGYDIENLVLVDNYGNGFYDKNGDLIAEYCDWEEEPYEDDDYDHVSTATLTLRSGYKCVMTEYSETNDGVSWYVTDRYFRFENENGHSLDEEEILEELEGTPECFLVERFISGGWPVFK